MSHWSLYLDESGDFDRDRGSVIAGLLVEAPLSHDLAVELRRALSIEHLGVAWPPHAWTLNSVEKLHEGILNRKASLTDAGRTFFERATPDAQADRLVEARGAIRDGLARLARRIGAPVYVVGAVRRPEGHSPLPPLGQVFTDAYVDTLAAVFTRVALALRKDHELVLVDTFVAERDVLHAGLRTPMALRPVSVRQIATAATRTIPGGATVNFQPFAIGQFEKAMPGVVAADHVANRLLRSVMSHRHLGWADVVRQVDRDTGLPVERGGPLLGAAGACHEATVAAANGAPIPSFPVSAPTWAHEQAQAWVEALRD